MALPVPRMTETLEEAVAQLKRDPSQPVHARVEGLEVELRVIGTEDMRPGLGSRLAAIGPWEGIALDDLMRLLAEARDAGGSAAPPETP
jgi:hypothetical protein